MEESLKKDYKHLEDATLNDYLWEFISRNDFYGKLYRGLKQELENCHVRVLDPEFLPSALNFKFITTSNLANDALKVMKLKFGIAPAPVEENAHGYYIKVIEANRKKYYLGIPQPYQERKGQAPATVPKPTLLGVSPLVTKKFNAERLNRGDEKYKYSFKVIEKLSSMGIENTLFIGIPLQGNRNKILNDLEKVVNANVTDENLNDKNIRSEDWKLYLFYYDRFKYYKDMNENEIKFLKNIEIYDIIKKESIATFGISKDIETIRKGITRAKKLIEKEYKDYLYY